MYNVHICKTKTQKKKKLDFYGNMNEYIKIIIYKKISVYLNFYVILRYLPRQLFIVCIFCILFIKSHKNPIIKIIPNDSNKFIHSLIFSTYQPRSNFCDLWSRIKIQLPCWRAFLGNWILIDSYLNSHSIVRCIVDISLINCFVN